jgi:hypothetical protein
MIELYGDLVCGSYLCSYLPLSGIKRSIVPVGPVAELNFGNAYLDDLGTNSMKLAQAPGR